jgi:hypothetical protein
MFFDRKSVLRAIAGWSVVFGVCACGQLGERDDLKKIMEFRSDTGCLNGLSERVEKYVEGEVTAAEWEKTWDCVGDSLDLFRKYVRGSDPRGYDQKDIQALVRIFLVTKTEINDELIQAIFGLKASLIGGDDKVLTKSEVEKFVKLHQLLKKESTALIPYLTNRRLNPNAENLLALSDAIQRVGANIASGLESEGNREFNRAAMTLLLKEVGKVQEKDLSPENVDFYLSIKVALAGGSLSGIDGSQWPLLLRAVTSYGGPLLVQNWMKTATFKEPNENGEVLLKIYRRLLAAAYETLSHRGGVLPLSTVDGVIDTLPGKWLELERGVSLKREALKAVLRPAVKKLLASGASDQAIDAKALDLVYTLFKQGTRSETHLEKIFLRLRDTVSEPEFTTAANTYAQGLDPEGRIEVDRLISIAKNFKGLYPEGSNEIKFGRGYQRQHSRNNLIRLEWLQIIAKHILDTYATGPEKRGTPEDLDVIMADFKPILKSIGKFHPEVNNVAAKRFLEANLFMFSSNGDKLMDLNETTYYLATILSSGSLSSRIQKRMWELCSKYGIGQDELGLQTIQMDCFRDNFFAEFETFWDGFPDLVESYRNLSEAKRQAVKDSIEISARRLGMTRRPISAYDIDGYAAIPHYVEALVQRFDANRDQILDKREILDDAYPMFKLTLAEKAKKKPSDTTFLQAVLTYIVRFGRQPEPGFNWDTAHFLGWYAWRPFWVVRADRAALYRVIAVLSKTPEKSEMLAGALSVDADITRDGAEQRYDWSWFYPEDSCYALPTEEEVNACR